MRLGVMVMACCLFAAACAAQGAAGRSTPSATTRPDASGPAGPVTVFAAASLTDAFEAIGAAFEEAHPASDVTCVFASSSTLATQITQGAPADVFAPADRTQMDAVADTGLVAGRPVAFAGNTLEIVVEDGNPLDIRGLADLTREDVTVVLAAEEVPAGRYAREALDAQGLDVRPASLETDVRAVRSRVVLGEADAGVVYASDIATAGDGVEGVAIPADENVPATYPIATLDDASNPAAARAFVDFVTSADGRRLLREHGFQPL